MSEPLEMNVDFETSDAEMNMDADMNCNVKVPLPIASATQLGGIKVGENLSITPDGTLSADVSDEDIEELQDDVSDLKEDLLNANDGLLHFGIIAKKYVNPSNGAFYTDASYSATDYIPCSDSVLIYTAEATPYGAWYDSSKNHVAGLSLGQGENMCAVPSGASYFATSTTTANISSLKVYSKIGAKLNSLKAINIMSGLDVTINSNMYINYENGRMGNSTGDGATDKISIVGGTSYTLSLYKGFPSVASRGIAYYKDGAFISGVPYVANKTTYTLVAPTEANQVAFTVPLSASPKYFELSAINNLVELDKYVKSVSSGNANVPTPNVFAFNTVGIVGDSFASGCSNYKDDQDVWHALDRKAFAWGKFLEKRQGCSVTLFSQGGMDTKTWFTNANGYAKAQNNPCECYYIGLGVNDYASRGAAYLGTISDVHVGSEDLNSDTFFGNYSKIIAKLIEIQPRCKIFCFTMPDSQSASQTRLDYDTAIRTVAALYGNAYLLDLAGDTFYISEPIISTFYGAHYLATGYSMMADHILEITNKLMLENLDDFADIQWITNNYPNSDTI